MPPAEAERPSRAVGLLVAIGTPALRGVIGVGASSIVRDTTVEPIAIEVREAGCRGILRSQSGSGHDDGQGLTPIGEPEVAVADDLGTRYEIGPSSLSGSLTGGEAESTSRRGHRSTIVIERFRESRLPPGQLWSGPPGGTPGPCEFSVELEPGPAIGT